MRRAAFEIIGFARAEYPDAIAQFASVLEMIGGRCVRVATMRDIQSELDRLAVYVSARQKVSRVAGAGVSTVDFDAIDDHQEGLSRHRGRGQA